MRVPIEKLSNNAHIWIFGISPSLDEQQSAHLQRTVDGFLENWAAHGVPITAAAEVREGSFLVVAADERSDKSGCSIDRMFGTLRKLEGELGVQILDSTRVFYREGENVRAIDRTKFRTAATPDTSVFDVTAERLGDVRQGAWERRAAESWHSQLL
ncbi:MAG TPA: hypothetical protein VE010_04125 [Thermoanaerobaculia bacterium]|nr:hypothetical protein [Thermoanaerobaculia bacterium]